MKIRIKDMFDKIGITPKVPRGGFRLEDYDDIWLTIIELPEWIEVKQFIKHNYICYLFDDNKIFGDKILDKIKRHLIEWYLLWSFSRKKNELDTELEIYEIPSYSQMLIDSNLASDENLRLLQRKINLEFKDFLPAYYELFCEDYEFYLHYERVLDTWILYSTNFKYEQLDELSKISSIISETCNLKYKIIITSRDEIYRIILNHPFTKLINDMFGEIITFDILVKNNNINTISVFTKILKEFDSKNDNDNFKPILVGGGTLMFNIEENRKIKHELLSWTSVFLQYGPYVFDEMVERTACWIPFERRLDINNISFWH